LSIIQRARPSVPFGFDIHALFLSDDAVGGETKIHQWFAERSVNRVSLRREYFYVTPSDVKTALTETAGNLLEFNEHAGAEQYRTSQLISPSEQTEVSRESPAAMCSPSRTDGGTHMIGQ
jgi:hypothetical protein